MQNTTEWEREDGEDGFVCYWRRVGRWHLLVGNWRLEYRSDEPYPQYPTPRGRWGWQISHQGNNSIKLLINFDMRIRSNHRYKLLSAAQEAADRHAVRLQRIFRRT